MTSGVQKVLLNDLKVEVANALIVAVIIAKQEARTFKSSSGQYNGEERGVWSFTVRDMSKIVINVTCWGGSAHVTMLSEMFKAGDVVDIVKPKISLRDISGRNENYLPVVNTPYCLVLNENQGSIIIHDGDDYAKFLPLLRVPTKSPNGFLQLADVETNHNKLVNTCVDVLVAVRLVGQHKTIQKDGRLLNVCNVIVMDRSHMGFMLTLWSAEMIERASQWYPRTTILFCADVKVADKKNSLNICSRSIVTVDPNCPEAELLRGYFQDSSLMPNSSSVLDGLDEVHVDVTGIKNVMSVANLCEKIDLLKSTDPGKMHNQFADYRFAAVVYAIITALDFTDVTKVVRVICPACQKPVSQQLGCCFNSECPVGSGSENLEPKTIYHIRTTLTDHVGHVSVVLTGKVVEEMLGCAPEEFKDLSESELSELRWKYLLERHEIKLVVTKKRDGKVDVKVLAISPANFAEVAINLPWY